MKRVQTETTIEVNGKRYDRLEDVPEPHRSMLATLLEDNDGDGVPDFVTNVDGNTMKVTSVTTNTTSSIHDLNTGEEIREDEQLQKLRRLQKPSFFAVMTDRRPIYLIIYLIILVAAIYFGATWIFSI